MTYRRIPYASDLSSSSPSIRNLCLEKATEEYDKDNIPHSVYYQVKALCEGMITKYFLKQCGGLSSSVQLFENKENLNFTKKCALKDFFKKSCSIKSENTSLHEPNTYLGEDAQNSIFLSENVENGIQSLMNTCRQFPEEWTILQLCKSYNPETTISLSSEILSSQHPVYLTILQHPRSNLFPKPICIKLDFKDDPRGNIFEMFFYINQQIKETCCFEGKDDKSNRAKFWKGMESLEKKIKEAIDDFKNLLGPWKCFFCGNVNESNRLIQVKLFEDVDKFSEKYNLDYTATVILSMLARQSVMLTESDIKLASLYLMETSKSNVSEDIFCKFLLELKGHLPIEKDFMPCILIIDEALDHIFWEMLNPIQEMCRINSFYMLEKLFRKYKHRLRKGYIRINVTTGNCIIDPDKTLSQMQQRMNSFFSYWVPDWKCLTGVAPSTEELMEKLISSADIFIYCGHGSGLQYINGNKIMKFSTESIIFLLGCDSVKLKSQGLHSEMVGSHIYYHAALSPAVIGCSVLALDFQLDTLSTNILSTWIPSKTAIHWSKIDKVSWKKGETIRIVESDCKSQPTYEPRLSLILANIRADESQTAINRITLFYRGLPVWNLCAAAE